MSDISAFSGSPAAVAQLATSMSNAELGNSTGITMLKKSMDMNEQTATQLIQSIPDASAALPDGVGGTINTTA